MSNSRGRSVYYTPSMTQMEAYDASPAAIRDAHKEGPQEWDTLNVLNRYKKMVRAGTDPTVAEKRVAKYVMASHGREIGEGKRTWTARLPGQRWRDLPDSPHNRANATMQVSGLHAGSQI
jgi:hypothetical protein